MRNHAHFFYRCANFTTVNIQKKNKVYPSSAAAVADIKDGANILIGGFGPCGLPENLIHAVRDTGVKDLSVTTNNSGKRNIMLSFKNKLYSFVLLPIFVGLQDLDHPA